MLKGGELQPALISVDNLGQIFENSFPKDFHFWRASIFKSSLPFASITAVLTLTYKTGKKYPRTSVYRVTFTSNNFQ